jgi:mitochondrial pyruvate carrier 2
MKWALVLAGVSDFFRPAEKLSLTQNLALTATGSIWTRWCFIIRPKNYLYDPSFPCSQTEHGHLDRTEESKLMFPSSSPRNRLAAVNFCLAIVGTVQVSRILAYRSSVAGSPEKALEETKEEVKSEAKGVKEEVKKAVA